MDRIDVLMDAALQALGTEAAPPDKPSEEAVAKQATHMLDCGYQPYDRVAFRALATYLSGEYNRKGGRGLLLTGEAGTGKTHFLTAVLRCQPLLTAAEIVNEYRDMQSYSTAFWFRVAGCYDSEIDHLAIDDLGQEPLCVRFGQKEEVMGEVVCRAYTAWKARGARVWVTTNLDYWQLEARYGRRLTDRLAEMTCVVQFTGKSNRGR